MKKNFQLFLCVTCVTGIASFAFESYAQDAVNTFPVLLLLTKAFGTGAIFYSTISLAKEWKLFKFRIGWIYRNITIIALLISNITMSIIATNEIAKYKNLKTAEEQKYNDIHNNLVEFNEWIGRAHV